mmetsp:Transcript_13463/g.18433  ORF Transcript_13463/g.18433 Transcript_13463/m.18433 type:complete len:213 (-) Transcript_13463:168-806(-)
MYQSASGGQMPPGTSCAICYTEDITAVKMPCCWREDGTMKFCPVCIKVLCDQSPGQVGRCPVCRAHFRLDPGTGRPQLCQNVGRCQVCCQEDKTIVQNNLCDACHLGTRYKFRYECENCHKFQIIPHPMWRYQERPDAFGNVSWACRARCMTYTKWRIVPHDASKVPPQECPDSWGRREEWIGNIRHQSRLEQAPLRAEMNNVNRNGGCAMM